MPLSKDLSTIPAPSIVTHTAHHFIPPYVNPSFKLAIYLCAALRANLEVNPSIIQLHILLTSQIWMNFLRTDETDRFIANWTANFSLGEVWSNRHAFATIVGTLSG